MNLLVFGLDGMDERLASCFDMPVLQSILKSNTALPMKEDLWSRGWVEILSGLSGPESGAFYERPKADGTSRFTQSFGTRDYESLANPPLWEVLTEKKIRSAWLNLPTTMPAAEVDGIMLSGAGGGVSPSDRLPRKACHPPELAKKLVQSRMNWENRFRG